jgi:hypothetical protein
MRPPRTTRSLLAACLQTGAALLLAGCASTYQTRGPAKPSPFLGDTSQLRAGKSGEAKLVYLNPKADFRKYTKIQLDPIVLVSGERLAAAVDERAGRKITLRFDKFRRYHTVESAADFWAERLQQRLAEFRAGQAGT